MLTTARNKQAIPTAKCCQLSVEFKKGKGKLINIIRHPVIKRIQTGMAAKALKKGGIFNLLSWLIRHIRPPKKALK